MKRIISLTLTLLVLLSLAGSAAFARGEYLGTLTVTNCREWVSLRSGPSTASARLKKVPLGAVVEAYYYNSRFYECRYNGTWGYILAENLTNGYTSSAYMGTMYVAHCNSYVTLRKNPSTSSAELARVPLGASVEAYYYDRQFAMCVYGDQQGYILLEYLSDEPARLSYMGTKHIVNCNSWVTLRKSPSTGAATVTRIPKGAAVEAYHYNGQFAYCEYNGLDGYVLLRYIG